MPEVEIWHAGAVSYTDSALLPCISVLIFIDLLLIYAEIKSNFNALLPPANRAMETDNSGALIKV